jgi:hypothetical protein
VVWCEKVRMSMKEDSRGSCFDKDAREIRQHANDANSTYPTDYYAIL